MALNALLKFKQGALIGADGESLVVAGGAPVTVENSTGATDVGSWVLELLYAPPGSVLFTATPVVLAVGGATAPTYLFTPDLLVYGLYRFRLTVYSGAGYTGSQDVDIRNVGVVTPNRKFLVFSPQVDPRPLPLTGVGAKPHEFNFNGQPFGWAGGTEPAARGLNDALLFLDSLTPFSGVPYQYYTLSLLGQTVFPLPDAPENGVIIMVVNGLVQQPGDYAVVANIVTYSGIPLVAGAHVSIYYWLDNGSGGGGTDPDAVHVNVANEIATVTTKATPVGADVFLIEDSEDLNLKKRVRLDQFPTAMDEKVKISATDTTAGVLNDKLTPGEGLRSSVLNPGGAEGLQLDLPDKTGHEPSAALELVPALRGLELLSACFDGTYIWVGADETSSVDDYNRTVITTGGWIRFDKSTGYIERSLFPVGNNTVTAALAIDAVNSRVLEVRVADVLGVPKAWVVTHTLTTPSVEGVPVALPDPGPVLGIRLFVVGPYIFIYGLTGGLLRLNSADLSVQVASAITGDFTTGTMLYDPTTRYGDGEGRVFTQLVGNTGYARWVPSTGVQDDVGQPAGAGGFHGIMLGIDPTNGRLWAVWDVAPAVTVGSFDCEPFAGNVRGVVPVSWIGSAAHASLIGGSFGGGLAYLAGQRPSTGYSFYTVESFSDSGAAIVEGDVVSDGALDAQYDISIFPQLSTQLLLNPGVALYLVPSVSYRAGEPFCARVWDFSVSYFVEAAPSEAGWAAAVKPAGDLAGDPRNPFVRGFYGKQINPTPVFGTTYVADEAAVHSVFSPNTQVISGTGATPQSLSLPYTGHLVNRVNDNDPLTLEIPDISGVFLDMPATIRVSDIKGNIGQGGSHLTLQTPVGDSIRLAEATPTTTLLMRSAYEEVVLVQTRSGSLLGNGWQVASRTRFWERIDAAANIIVKSGYALVAVDTAAAVEVTLIAAPQHDDWCIIKDVTGDAFNHSITVNGNGKTIDGQASRLITINYGYLKLRYDAVLDEWLVVAERALPAQFASVMVDHTLAAGDNHDVSPVGWAAADIVRLTSGAGGSNITGFVAVTAGDCRVKHLYHIGVDNITIAHLNAGSAAGNRCDIPGDVTLTLEPGDVVTIMYDIVTALWRVG